MPTYLDHGGPNLSGGRVAVTMRYGYWLPVFGGWLRNVADERMAASWDYVKRLAAAASRSATT